MNQQITTFDWIRGYWAKAPRSKDEIAKLIADGKPAYHPVAWHLLDIAAAGRALLELRPSYFRTLRNLSGIEDDEQLLDWICFLLALHDIGKFFEGFQGNNEHIRRHLGKRVDGPSETKRHDELGYAAFKSWSETRRFLLPPIGIEAPDRGDTPNSLGTLAFWLKPVFGHHSAPVGGQRNPSPGDQLPEATRSDLEHYVEWLSTRFLPTGPPAVVHERLGRPRKRRLALLSWWLAGFVSLADAIGSSEEWFEYESPERSPDDYWENVALPRGRRAVRDIGLEPRPRPSFDGISDLFPECDPPTPMQERVEQVPLGDGPGLWILEEPTGSGKTEAAWYLAQRLIQADRAEGVYLALPTQATTESMYRRLRKTHSDAVMIHGEARSERYGRTLDLDPGGTDEADSEEDDAKQPSDDNEPPAAVELVSEWLTENARKAFLADPGIGTIDQALSAVLPSPFQGMRLLGLAEKVLIVDEVHAYDVYSLELLKKLLWYHAAVGGSAILLSATLPHSTRKALEKSFEEGLEYVAEPSTPETSPSRTPEDPASQDSATEIPYPLFARVDRGGRWTTRVPAWDRSKREITVKIEESEEAMGELLLDAMRERRCGVWIRNTVADAQVTWRRLRARASELGLDPDRVEILHARYTRGDRMDREKQILGYFGNESGRTEREGRILVATQVVEQSLDLDFDVMVSDLAPIDLLIQRSGRLQRHPRTTRGDRLGEGSDQRPVPTLHVLAPPWSEEPTDTWCSDHLPGTARVYEDQGILWLTLRALREVGEIRVPEGDDEERNGVRHLVEAVYGDVPPELDAKAKALAREARHESKKRQDRARKNSSRLKSGYSQKAARHHPARSDCWKFWPSVPTRSGPEQAEVYLIRRDEEGASWWRMTGGGGKWPDHQENARVRISQPLLKRHPAVVPWEKLATETRSDVKPNPRGGKSGLFLELREVAEVWRSVSGECGGALVYGALGLAENETIG